MPDGLGPGRTDCSDRDGVEGDLHYNGCVSETQG